ncbi:LysE family transporter [Streptomyces silvae]|nr:LysE family transporter [Streptomyces silvae]
MTAATSLRTGAAAALGAATADAGYAVAAVLGGSALVVVVRPVLGPLRWAAFAILAFMAARILAGALGRNRGEPGAPAVSGASATASSGTPDTSGAPARRRITPLRAYLAYFSLTALNRGPPSTSSPSSSDNRPNGPSAPPSRWPTCPPLPSPRRAGSCCWQAAAGCSGAPSPAAAAVRSRPRSPAA